MLQELLRHYRKLIPMGLLLTLVVMAGGTLVFGKDVHEAVRAQFVEFGAAMLPYAIHMLVAFILLNIAWLLYGPLTAGLDRVLDKSGVSPRAKNLSSKILKTAYWGVIIFVVLGITAAEFLSKFAMGFGAIGVALTLALQGVANDAICGLLLQFCRKVNEGDDIEIEGSKVCGKVLSVGYLSTLVKAPNGVDHVPNREIWSKTVRVVKPKSSIIVPPGVELNRRG